MAVEPPAGDQNVGVMMGATERRVRAMLVGAITQQFEEFLGVSEQSRVDASLVAEYVLKVWDMSGTEVNTLVQELPSSDLASGHETQTNVLWGRLWSGVCENLRGPAEELHEVAHDGDGKLLERIIAAGAQQLATHLSKMGLAPENDHSGLMSLATTIYNELHLGSVAFEFTIRLLHNPKEAIHSLVEIAEDLQ